MGIAAAVAVGLSVLIEGQMSQNSADKAKERSWVNVAIIFLVIFALGIAAVLFLDSGETEAVYNMKTGEPAF